MSNYDYATTIELEFDKPIVNDPEIPIGEGYSIGGFTVTADEYDRIPDGTLQETQYVLKKIKYPNPRITAPNIDLSSGTLSDVTLTSNTLELALEE